MFRRGRQATPSRELDDRTRDLIRAAAPNLSTHLGVPRLDRELLAELYVQLRRTLASPGAATPIEDRDPEGLASELALTIYLVTLSFQPSPRRDPHLLAALHQSVVEALAGSGSSG